VAVYRTDGLLPMIPPESLERRKRRCQIAASTHRNPTSPVGILGIRMRQAPRSRGYITVTSLAHAGHSRKPPRRTLRDSSRDSWRRPSPPPSPPPPKPGSVLFCHWRNSITRKKLKLCVLRCTALAKKSKRRCHFVSCYFVASCPLSNRL